MSWITPHTSRTRVLGVALATLPLVATAALAAPQAGASASRGDGFRAAVNKTLAAPSGRPAGNPGVRVATDYRLIHSGLDNPRQISLTRGGGLIVAEAGHGSYNEDRCQGGTCVGYSSQVTLFRNGHKRTIMDHLISGAGADGSFAIGVDGAGKRPGGPFVGIETWAPRQALPPGVNGKRLGKLLARDLPDGSTHIIANVTGFEQRHDPDGEGFDSDPYSVLALGNQVLVADAAGDSILSYRGGRLHLWKALPDPGPRIDPVPTVISRGGNGHVYVGTLWSERPGKARVFEYTRAGRLLHVYRGFTTITGVAAKANGTLYVSELFGGCKGGGPQCTPGRVVKANTGHGRVHMRVPFPAGIVARGGRTQVAAWSVAPAIGFGGDPDTSGAIWRLRF